MTKIKKVLQACIRELGMNPTDINNGNCDNFAWMVYNKIKNKNIKIYETDFGSPLPSHFWIRYREKFYDAECLEGVKDYHSLSIFKDSQNRGDMVNIYD